MGLRGDGDCCLKVSVAACRTSVFLPSGLVCDPVRGRRDNSGEMNAGDENCGSAGGSGAKGGHPPLVLDKARGTRGLTPLSE